MFHSDVLFLVKRLKFMQCWVHFCRYDDQISAESIGQLVFLSGREGLFQGEHLKYMLRLYWLKAHLFLNQGSSEIAMQSLHTVRLFILMWDNLFCCVCRIA
jgi:hypothetical protein